jgi:hypothetical protein
MSKVTKARKKTKKIRYKVGDIVEVETFAGPNIYQKVKKKINRTTKWKTMEDVTVEGFDGVFVRRKDLYSLKKACVPYTGKEKLKDTESFSFDWQILKIIKRK